MKLLGYCTVCHRHRWVDVSGAEAARAAFRTPEGVCDECLDRDRRDA